MYFKGTIVITDPCYIIKENPIKYPNKKDFGLPASISSKPFKDYSTPEELAYKAALDKYYKESRKYDDWDKCDFGENMEVLGIHNYISESTIYGDWSCTTYQIEENPKETIDKLVAAYKKSENEYVGVGVKVIKDLGDFCADAGLVSVFYLDEILKYNPDFSKWAEEHSWCVTTIPNFDGEVEYYVDTNDEAHIIGTGNINFFTAQTGV